MSAVAQAKWDVAYFPAVAQVAQQMQKGQLEKKKITLMEDIRNMKNVYLMAGRCESFWKWYSRLILSLFWPCNLLFCNNLCWSSWSCCLSLLLPLFRLYSSVVVRLTHTMEPPQLAGRHVAWPQPLKCHGSQVAFHHMECALGELIQAWL